MHTVKQILYYLPKITSDGLDEVLNIIEQSRKFNNHQNNTVADNEFELRYANYLGTQDPKFVDYYQTIVEQAKSCRKGLCVLLHLDDSHPEMHHSDAYYHILFVPF